MPGTCSTDGAGRSAPNGPATKPAIHRVTEARVHRPSAQRRHRAGDRRRILRADGDLVLSLVAEIGGRDRRPRRLFARDPLRTAAKAGSRSARSRSTRRGKARASAARWSKPARRTGAQAGANGVVLLGEPGALQPFRLRPRHAAAHRRPAGRVLPGARRSPTRFRWRRSPSPRPSARRACATASASRTA